MSMYEQQGTQNTGFPYGIPTSSSLSANMHFTPQGYLLCVGVPIARTGIMYYANGEIPHLKAGPNGLVEVTRDASVVFSPQAMMSFEGQPITVDHPEEDVGPRNWKNLACGYLRNVRQGTGADSYKLIADALITDEYAIDSVIRGRRGISCGYDAKYEQSVPGYAKQISITGNHVALVSNPRCGQECSIRDEKPMTKLTKSQFAKKIRDAFRARDEEKLDEALSHIGEEKGAGPDQGGENTNLSGEKEKPEEKKDESGNMEKKEPDEEKDDSTHHHHITVNVGGMPNGDGETKPPMGNEEKEEASDPLSQLLEMMESLIARVAALEGKSPNKDDSMDGGSMEPTEDEESEEARMKKEMEQEEEKKRKEESALTKDSSVSLANEWQEIVAAAEILSPGISIPTFDSASPMQKTRDVLCIFKRRSLAMTVADERRASLVTNLLPSSIEKNPGGVARMTCDAVDILFQASAESARLRNKVIPPKITPIGKKFATNASGINAKNSEFWSKHR